MPDRSKSKTEEDTVEVDEVDAVDPVADSGDAEDPEEVFPEEKIVEEEEETSNGFRKQLTDQFSSIWMKAQKLSTTQIYPTPAIS